MSEKVSANIACLGPEGSFSHEFALRKFPDDLPQAVEGEFSHVIDKLKDGTCSYAVVPFLNSNGVHVRPAQAAIAAERDWICVEGCFPHQVSHNLVVTEHFRTLRRVVSKEQVFPQCSNWLDQWSGIEQCAATSTSAALRNLLAAPIAEQHCTGAICNQLAQELYGGIIKYPKIQNPGNITLFLVLSRRMEALQPPRGSEILLCLTCPTEDCYRLTINDFSRAGFPLKFSSLKGEFTDKLPCFLQFEVRENPELLQPLLQNPHRHLLGNFPTEKSLAACVSSFFDDI